MLLSYLKLSLRLLARNPFFTFINVAGLSVGFVVFFILWPFTQSELKSDQFIKDYERIARPYLDWRWTDNGGESWGHLNMTAVASHVAGEMRNHSAVEDVTRYIPQDWFWANSTPGLQSELVVTMERPGESPTYIKMENSICADQNFFEFFDLPFVHGDRGKALSHTHAAVLSQRASQSFFGNENPVGKTLKVNRQDFQVTGVFENVPRHSHLQFDVAFSNIAALADWNSINKNEDFWIPQYFKMKGDPAQLAAILNENKESLIGYYLEKNQHIKIDFMSQPLSEIAFSQGYAGDSFKSKSKFMLKILAGVSIVVLIMAWMNYVNLTVSRTKTRFKEIAARKVSGALLPDLFLQFICQSAVINVLAALIGLTIIQLVRLPFDQFLNIHIVSFFDLDNQTILFFLTVFTIGIMATAGYPAWVTLKHSTRQLLTKNVPGRKRITTTIFTTAQYVAALSLIAWIFVMNSQLEFILNKDLGVDKENVIVMNAPVLGLEENGNQKMVSFADLIKSKLNAEQVSLSGRVCGDFPWDQPLRRVGSDVFYGIDAHGGVDENYIPTFNLKLIIGRNFNRDEVKPAIILSRFASERLGFKSPEEAVGSIIEAQAEGVWHKLEVIGAIEDYRVTPYYAEEGSTESVTGRGQCFTYLNALWKDYVPQRISIKLSKGAMPNLKELEELYSQQFPGNIFNWYFLDDNINRQYGDQKIARNQLTFFTVLAVGVACLGLLGMISNKVAEKFKEISVRRILGAQNHHVVSLVLGSTGVQIGIALLIGVPISYKFSNQYLEKYTDHISLQWWHFALPVLILVVIMFFTIASVLWKAARSNPVEALKYE